MRPLLLVGLLGGAVDETALRKKLGCDEGCTLVSVEDVHVRAGRTDVAVRTRRTGHCGVVADWTLLDADLQLLLTIDEEVDRSCGGHEEHRRLRVTVDKGVVRAGGWCWRGDTHLAKFTCKSK